MKNKQIQKKIPNGWKRVKLGDVSVILAGGTPSTKRRDFWGGSISWMNSGDLNKKKVFEVKGRITELGLKSSAAKMLPENTVLIGLAGQGKTRGTVAINKIELCTNQSVAAIMPNKELNFGFLFLDLDRRYRELRSISAGDGGRGGLNLQILKFLKINLPPIKEQSKVVKILETWNEAIEKLGKKIEIKKRVKKGLMRELLTGKTRLPGFSGEWEFFKLGGICVISKGEQLNKNTLKGGGKYAAISGGIEASGYTDQWNTDENTIIISEGGNSCGYINFITEKFWCGGHCYAIKNSKDFDKFFLYQKLKLNEPKIMKLRVGSGLPNIQKNSLDTLKLKMPKDIKEQNAIANILTAADNEIMGLERKLEILKNQKRFLLNKLVTGEIRVPKGV